MARRVDTTGRVVGYLVADERGPVTRNRISTAASSVAEARKGPWFACLSRAYALPGHGVRLFGSRGAATKAIKRARAVKEIKLGRLMVYEVRA